MYISGVLVNGKDEISLRPQGHFFTVKSNTSPSPAYHTKAVVPAAGSLSLLSKTIGETSKLSLNPTFIKQVGFIFYLVLDFVFMFLEALAIIVFVEF